MKARTVEEKRVPFIVDPDEQARGPHEHLQFCLDRRESLQERLLTHGAILLRGLPVLTPHEFAEFVSAFSQKPLQDYVGGASPRIKLERGVYTSTEYSHAISLSLHNELSYTYSWPAQLFFHCVVPPEEGGETPLADSRAVLRKIDARVLSRFKTKGIRYVRNLSDDAGSGYSWQDAFESSDKRAVEDYCRRGPIDFRWTERNHLRLLETRPATARHPLTGEEVWFNQAEGFHPSALDDETYQALIRTMKEDEFRLNAHFGDGTPLDVAELEHVREVVRGEMVLVPWQRGDILILDNMLTAHGRMPFKGARRIMLAMT
jgi:alpha-ketoglutarate-dependent taurine dioxygenase